MGGVPFIMWKLPASAYDDADSDSTFYEPEDKNMANSINEDSYTNSKSSNLIYEEITGSTEMKEKPNIKEISNYKNQNTDEDSGMDSIMAELASLLQNGVLEEEKCNTYYNGSTSTGTSNVPCTSFEQKENVRSELVCYDLQSSLNDGLAIEDEQSMIMETRNFNVSNNPTEQNTQNYDNIRLNDNSMLKEINDDLHYSKLVEFNMPPEDSSLCSTHTNDLLTNFDSETLNDYDSNINFLLENDRFHDILKCQDFQDGMRITDEGYNVWSSATASCYSIQKRKCPNPKQWPKIRKLKSVSCKGAERTLPQRNCQSKWTRNNRKVCNSEDFVELSVKKRKGKQVEVNLQGQQHLSSDNYITSSTSQRYQRKQPQSWKRFENEHSFQSIEDIKYLEKVKVALNVLSFRIEKWTSGQDEHPPTRNEAVNMLQYVGRVHTNLNDKVKKYGEKKGKTLFLRVAKDSEQLFLKIKNAIGEADRLYQMEQEELLEMINESSETILSGIDIADNTSMTQSDGPTSSWLSKTEQAQFINENTIMSKIPDRQGDNYSNKIKNRKRWLTNGNGELVSYTHCQKDIPFKALNNINATTKKSILKSSLKETENYKKERKRLSFSDVVSYIPDKGIFSDKVISSDNFTDECENVYKISQNKCTNNRQFDTDPIEFSYADINYIPKNADTVQKQHIRNNNTYMTETSISNYAFGHVEDITLKKQANINDRLPSQIINTERISVTEDIHDSTLNVNPNHQQGHTKKHTNENSISNNCYQSSNNGSIVNINNKRMTKNESHSTSLQNNGLVKHSKQIQMQTGEIIEVESDISFKQCQEANNKYQVNKLTEKCNHIKDNTFIKTAGNNSIDDDDDVFVVSKAVENDGKCSTKVGVLPVKRKGAKKKLNPMHNKRKSNHTNLHECRFSNRFHANISQNESVEGLNNIKTVENIEELESRQCVNNSYHGNHTQMVSSNENKRTTDKPVTVQYNMNVNSILKEEQTNNNENLHEKYFTQNNIGLKYNQINQGLKDLDETQPTMRVDCDLKQIALTDMKVEKVNEYKQQNKTSTAACNLQAKRITDSNNICLGNINFNIRRENTIHNNKDMEKQNSLSKQVSEANKFTPLVSTQHSKSINDSENHSTSNINETRLNSIVHDKNKFMNTQDNTSTAQKLINHKLYFTKEDPCTEQNVSCHKDQLMAHSIPEQFKNMKISNESQGDNISESQQYTLTSEFTFDDVHSCDDSNTHNIDIPSDVEKNSFDWCMITIMDVKRVRIKHESEHIPNSEIIFDSDELFKDLNMW